MTSTSAFCGACGAPNLGTRFCESCGTRAPGFTADAAPALGGAVPATAASALAAPVARLLDRRNLGFALVLAGLIVPPLIDGLIVASRASWTPDYAAQIVLGLIQAALVVGGFVTAVVMRRPAAGPAIGGGVLGLVGGVLMVASSSGAWVLGGLAGELSTLITGAAVLIAWCLIAGTRPRAYLGLLILLGAVVVDTLSVYLASPISALLHSYTAIAAVSEVIHGILVLVVAVLTWRLSLGVPRPRVVLPDHASGSAVAVPVERTNTLAVFTLVFGLMGGTVLPIVFGHVALAQIARSGERGRGLAIAGLVLGYLVTVTVAVILIAVAVAVPRY